MQPWTMVVCYYMSSTSHKNAEPDEPDAFVF